MPKTYRSVSVLLIIVFSVMATQAKIVPYVEDQDEEWGSFDDPFALDSTRFNNGLFGQLNDDEDIDVFHLEYEADAPTLEIQLMVPVCDDEFVDFYPSLAIVSEAFEGSEVEMELPFEVDEELGLIVLEEEERGSKRRLRGQWQLFDQFYYQHTIHEVEIPQASDYWLVVWEPDGNAGAYNLTILNETSTNHGDDRDSEEVEEVFRRISNGDWMGADCE